MLEGVYFGLDFGFKQIGVAVGQTLTQTATALPYLHAEQGQPDWGKLQKLIEEWRPVGFIVGLPTTIEGKALYTTKAAKKFALQLKQKFHAPVYLVDERLSTKEARSQIFNHAGGFRQLKKGRVDSVAACIILEQWLQYPEDAYLVQ